MLSVDIPTLGKRYNEHKNKFALPKHLKFPNLPEGVDVHGMSDGDPRVSYSREVTWELLKEVVDKTHLPVFLKGSEYPHSLQFRLVLLTYISHYGGRCAYSCGDRRSGSHRLDTWRKTARWVVGCYRCSARGRGCRRGEDRGAYG